MKRRLEGKVAIVTGAGSRGEGWGNGMTIAILFAREGAHVLLVHRDESVANKTLAIIQEEGGSAAIYKGDVGIEADLKGMVETAVAKFGGLDILVNNVGPHSQPGLFNESEEDWNMRFRVNVTSVFLGAKFAVPHMIRRGGGRIINISSISALRSGRVPGYAYAASKAALQRLTKDLALEFAPKGIRANAIVVGMMNTPNARHAYASTGLSEQEVEAIMRKRDALSPTGKMGTSFDVAHAALYLASDEANYVNGIDLVVDGGYTLLNAAAAPAA